MAALEVAGLSIVYGGLRAIDELSFRVDSGRILGLIGPNGAGKTSLFNAIAGLTTPTAGDVRLDGRSILGLRPFQRAAAGLARTFQNLRIFPELSVVENVMLGRAPRMRAGFLATLLRVPGAAREEAEVAAMAGEKLRLVGLAHLAHAPAHAISFGEAKLVELARALMADPAVLMLDEPTAGVPAAEQNRFLELVGQVNANGVTVVLVEHNVRVVTRLAHDILVLHHGRLLAHGAPDDVVRDPAVVSAYLGDELAHA